MLDAITQYILALVPAVTALVGMAVCVGVGVGKIKRANRDTVDSIDRASKKTQTLEEQLQEVHNENVQIKKENVYLKKQLNEVMARMKHMYFVENDNSKEE